MVTEVSKHPITPAIATGLSQQVITVIFSFKSYFLPSKRTRLSLSLAFLTEKSSGETSFPIKLIVCPYQTHAMVGLVLKEYSLLNQLKD